MMNRFVLKRNHYTNTLRNINLISKSIMLTQSKFTVAIKPFRLKLRDKRCFYYAYLSFVIYFLRYIYDTLNRTDATN